MGTGQLHVTSVGTSFVICSRPTHTSTHPTLRHRKDCLQLNLPVVIVVFCRHLLLLSSEFETHSCDTMEMR